MLLCPKRAGRARLEWQGTSRIIVLPRKQRERQGRLYAFVPQESKQSETRLVRHKSYNGSAPQAKRAAKQTLCFCAPREQAERDSNGKAQVV